VVPDRFRPGAGKATQGTEFTDYEIERNKTISKVLYIVEYFGWKAEKHRGGRNPSPINDVY
jgi:hypothetical protein